MSWPRKNDQRVVAPEHCAYLAHARAREARANRFEESRADAGLPAVGLDVDREDPTAGRRSVFPVPNLTDDEPDDAFPGVCHEELPLDVPGVAVTAVYGPPIITFLEPGHGGIDGDDLGEIAGPHRPDDEGAAGAESWARTPAVRRPALHRLGLAVVGGFKG